MIAADLDWWTREDELIAGFIGYGLYYYDDDAWTQINTVVPENLVHHSDKLVCDFGAAYGLWFYGTSGGFSQD